MTKFRFTIQVLAIAALTLAFASIAQAQASRTWVSGVGDDVTSAASLVIVHHAWRLGAPPSVLKRMIGNIGLDFLLGSIPILGDAFDRVWKANRRNAELVEMFVQGQSSQQVFD